MMFLTAQGVVKGELARVLCLRGTTESVMPDLFNMWVVVM